MLKQNDVQTIHSFVEAKLGRTFGSRSGLKIQQGNPVSMKNGWEYLVELTWTNEDGEEIKYPINILYSNEIIGMFSVSNNNYDEGYTAEQYPLELAAAERIYQSLRAEMPVSIYCVCSTPRLIRNWAGGEFFSVCKNCEKERR